MAQEIELKDSMLQWQEKINRLIGEFNTLSVASDGAFAYVDVESSGLNAVISGGLVRDNSETFSLDKATVTLAANSTVLVGIYRKYGTPEIKSYLQSQVPASNVIPVALFTTNATSIVAYSDYRAKFSFTSNNRNGGSTAVFQIDSLVDLNTTVPAGKNALSVSPTVQSGVTVTVENGSTWVIL